MKNHHIVSRKVILHNFSLLFFVADGFCVNHIAFNPILNPLNPALWPELCMKSWHALKSTSCATAMACFNTAVTTRKSSPYRPVLPPHALHSNVTCVLYKICLKYLKTCSENIIQKHIRIQR